MNDENEERLDILELIAAVRTAQAYSLYGKATKKKILRYLNDCLEV